MTEPRLDPVSVLTGAAAIFFSNAAATYIGPYLIIMIGSTLGAYMALGDRDKTSRASGAGFFMAANAAAFLSTVLFTKLTKLVLPFLEDVDDSWLFGLVAWAIGLLGHRWREAPRAITWLRGFIGRAGSRP